MPFSTILASFNSWLGAQCCDHFGRFLNWRKYIFLLNARQKLCFKLNLELKFQFLNNFQVSSEQFQERLKREIYFALICLTNRILKYTVLKYSRLAAVALDVKGHINFIFLTHFVSVPLTYHQERELLKCSSDFLKIIQDKSVVAFQKTARDKLRVNSSIDTAQ